MKTSLAWLNRYLDNAVNADELERALTEQGFPIEATESVDADVMLDVEVTSNRSDCLSHVGLAREISAGTGRQLRGPAIELPAASGDVAGLTSVVNEAPDLCPVYTARVITGVKVGPSPQWLVDCLSTIGLRSVNNVVDVTNFVLMETGQPLHAFDMNLLKEKRIVVRRATKGEEFTAIDGTQHKLDDAMLVIADASRPVAVAGVMGGLESEVGESTTDILLESARFDPLSIRRTSRKLKLASDSSFRFERGVDGRGVDRASQRAAQLIVELAGGALAEGVIRVGEDEPSPHTVTMRVARCNHLLGIEMTGQHMVDLLDALGLSPELDEAEQTITARIPTFRLDLHREVDLIEEVARMHGLDDLAMHQRLNIEVRPLQDSVAARQAIGKTLVAHGYHETVTFSFISPRLGEPFLRAGDKPLVIEDERRKAEPMLRPALAPSLLTCRKANQDVGNHGLKLFEAAAVWSRNNGAIVERSSLCLLCDAEDIQQAVRDVRGTLSELIEQLSGRADVSFEPADIHNTSSAAQVVIGGESVGYLGALDDTCRDRFDLQTAIVVAELDLDSLTTLYPPDHQVGELARFPAIERDVSIVVDETVNWQSIASHVHATQPQLLEDLRFVVTYRGKPIAKGQKCVTLRMVFRDPAQTLRHDQVDPQVDAVVRRLQTELGAQLRS